MKRLKRIFGVVIILLLVGVLGLLAYEDIRYPGPVQGTKPWYRLKSALPTCNYNGSSFAVTPCYAPPNSHYE